MLWLLLVWFGSRGRRRLIFYFIGFGRFDCRACGIRRGLASGTGDGRGGCRLSRNETRESGRHVYVGPMNEFVGSPPRSVRRVPGISRHFFASRYIYLYLCPTHTEIGYRAGTIFSPHQAADAPIGPCRRDCSDGPMGGWGEAIGFFVGRVVRIFMSVRRIPVRSRIVPSPIPGPSPLSAPRNGIASRPSCRPISSPAMPSPRCRSLRAW